ncbi:MAG: glycoside hydrolase family 2 TIM barrel-domain containing protein [Bacillota bacterium]
MLWKLGYSASKGELPIELINDAPTAEVALIYREKGILPDYNLHSNFRQYEWMEDKWWHYSTDVIVEKITDKVPFIEFKGLDCKCSIYINEALVFEGEGMFTPVKLDLSRYEGTSISLRVLFHPVPKKTGKTGANQAIAAVKPAVSYGWDFHPRLVPVGFYDEVNLTYEPKNRIEVAEINYFIPDDLSKVTGQIEILTNGFAGTCEASILDERQTAIWQESTHGNVKNDFDFEIASPKLWWCVGHGAQNFYTLRVQIMGEDGVVTDSYEKRIGFRKIRLVMNEGAWEGEVFPKTQAKVPITIELNGKRIFAKGTNLTPGDIFGSRLNREFYLDLLTNVRDCNMNIVRLWGGGIVNKESFFELCDEMGIMVWQEFPLACNNYEDDLEYLRVLDVESRSIILRLKKHPCVIMWCGGNELFCSWSGMTNQAHALRLLDRNCFELDRHTPFLATSPLYGMGHGHYMPLNDDGSEVMTQFMNSDFTAYTEFGMPAPASLEILQQIISEKDFGNIATGTDWEVHAALNSWDMRPNTWFCIDQICRYFGRESSFEQLLENGRLLQKEVYKNLFEEMRRKWPRNSMALNWCFNEPWPTAANNSVLSYPLEPKPSYYGIQMALRDRLISLRFEKMIWKAGDEICVEIFQLNEHNENDTVEYKILVTDLVGATLMDLGKYNLMTNAEAVELLGDFKFKVAESLPSQFKIRVLKGEVLENEYILFKTQ